MRRSCRCRSQRGCACKAKAGRAPTSSGWLTQAHADVTAQAQQNRKERESLNPGQQTAMSDHASREEVVRRVEAKLKIARENGEFGNFDDTEQKILSIARNTCGEYLE